MSISNIEPVKTPATLGELFGDLSYNKTFEEEMEEKRKLDLAINHLEGLGVEVVSEYGFYRNIYNVLKDLGECLDKKQENLKGKAYGD